MTFKNQMIEMKYCEVSVYSGATSVPSSNSAKNLLWIIFSFTDNAPDPTKNLRWKKHKWKLTLPCMGSRIIDSVWGGVFQEHLVEASKKPIYPSEYIKLSHFCPKSVK